MPPMSRTKTTPNTAAALALLVLASPFALAAAGALNAFGEDGRAAVLPAAFAWLAAAAAAAAIWFRSAIHVDGALRKQVRRADQRSGVRHRGRTARPSKTMAAPTGGGHMSVRAKSWRRGLLALTAMLAAVPQEAAARITIGGEDGLEISGEIFNFTEIRLGERDAGPTYNLFAAPGVIAVPGEPFSRQQKYERVSAMRTELTLEMVYRGIPHVTPVVRLRPYYDASYPIEDREYDDIGRFWKTNFVEGMHDEWDPLFREVFADFNFHPLFVRAGRQIVTWGRSDGVVVLDVVNPRNFRNPLTFEQERFMIPQWMINTTLDFSSYDWMPGGSEKELQVIWNLNYLPSRFPGFRSSEEGQNSWTLNVVDFANQVINTSDALFGSTNFFDDDNYEGSGSFLTDTELFVKWRGTVSKGLGPLNNFTYSFHFAHLYNDVPTYELQDRIDLGLAIDIAGPRAAGGGIDFTKHRYQMYGFSFDKALEFLPGQFQGTVLRGELAYNRGDRFYEPDLNLRRSDQVTYLIGLDQYLYLMPRSWVETPWFVSFQFWQDWILRDAGRGRYTNLGTPACEGTPGCGDKGYIIGGEYDLFNGLRDQRRSIVTLYMFNDFLPGKTLRVELFGLHEFEKEGTWFRFVVGYNFTSNLSARLGTNVIFGNRDSFIGQFDQQDVVFSELKFTF